MGRLTGESPVPTLDRPHIRIVPVQTDGAEPRRHMNKSKGRLFLLAAFAILSRFARMGGQECPATRELLAFVQEDAFGFFRVYWTVVEFVGF